MKCNSLYVILSFAILWIFFFLVIHEFHPDFLKWTPQNTFANTYFIGFLFIFIMVLWCFLKTALSNPLPITVLLGYYMEGIESKQKRYCLICRIFKPERCHHCSTCGKCFLKMDHHCPWLNSCIGVHNRKSFFLLLVYLNMAVFYILGGYSSLIYEIITHEKQFKYEHLWKILPSIFLIAFAFHITQFLHFHINLISRNLTTIDLLLREQINIPLEYPSQFDQGLKNNWLNELGHNYFLWPFPVFTKQDLILRDYNFSSAKSVQSQPTEISEMQTKSIGLNENNILDLESQSTNTLAQKSIIPPQYISQLQSENLEIISAQKKEVPLKLDSKNELQQS